MKGEEERTPLAQLQLSASPGQDKTSEAYPQVTVAGLLASGREAETGTLLLIQAPLTSTASTHQEGCGDLGGQGRKVSVVRCGPRMSHICGLSNLPLLGKAWESRLEEAPLLQQAGTEAEKCSL